jgi:cytochrome P450
VRGSNHTLLYELHRKHGAFVRYGPNHISINSATALEQIYSQKSNVKKGNWYGRFYSISIFNAVDKDVHARKKRVMSHAFSDAALRGMQPHIISAIRAWCTALGDNTDPDIAPKKGEWSSPKDMAHWGAYMIFDVLGEICFGRSFYTSIKNDNRYFLDLMVKNVRITNVMGQMPVLHELNFGTIMRWGDKEQYAKQIAFSRKQLQNRLTVGSENSKRRDIIYYLQQARDPETGEGYLEKELMSETTLLLGAG